MKLQNSLQGMQNKVNETNALLVKEREVAQKAIEEAAAAVKETPVHIEDTEKIEALSAEVETLKVMLVFNHCIISASLTICSVCVHNCTYCVLGIIIVNSVFQLSIYYTCC